MPATIPQPAEAGLQSPFDLSRALLANFYSSSSPFGSLKLPIGFATANSAVLATIPTGLKVRLHRVYWEIATSFTGGTSSAIGVSSSNANYNTAGDLLGGASGDVAAALVSTGGAYKSITIGAKLATSGVVVLVGGDTIIFNRITSIFTAGAGFVHADYQLID